MVAADHPWEQPSKRLAADEGGGCFRPRRWSMSWSEMHLAQVSKEAGAPRRLNRRETQSTSQPFGLVAGPLVAPALPGARAQGTASEGRRAVRRPARLGHTLPEGEFSLMSGRPLLVIQHGGARLGPSGDQYDRST